MRRNVIASPSVSRAKYDPAALDEMRAVLVDAIEDDGGVGWHAGDTAEAEPTAVAALALGDDRCVDWLIEHQDDDGGFSLVAGPVENTSVTALAALALPAGDARERALDRAVADRSARVEGIPDYPLAWGWTPTTYSWAEPTARVLLALRLLRADATTDIDEAVASLTERQTDAGGWNYGNADVRGTDLKPYAQTTAVALLALQGLGEIAERGTASLVALAPEEPGGLSLAQSILALRVVDDERHAALWPLLTSGWSATRFLGNLGTIAWAVLATGDRIEQLRVTP